MAVEDSSAPHGVKLLIEDYPYAADGLLIWSAIESWVSEYVSIYYYEDPQNIIDDEELQSWWEEIRDCGHADKKNEPWWPKLENQQDLIFILSTLMWVCSGMHAAVNFGQFAYAGYVPNKPTLTRRLIPEENTPEFRELLCNPQKFLLSVLPSQAQATVLMAVVESLSSHSPDEEYLGYSLISNWTDDPRAIQAHERFILAISNIEKIIKQRNEDPKLKNRHGAGILPYELLFPWSPPGITGRGVPNSISI